MRLDALLAAEPLQAVFKAELCRGQLRQTCEFILALIGPRCSQNLLHRTEYGFRRPIHHSEIFLVEFTDRFGLGVLAPNSMTDQIDEGFGVTLGLHAHECGQLRKARVEAVKAEAEDIEEFEVEFLSGTRRLKQGRAWRPRLVAAS